VVFLAAQRAPPSTRSFCADGRTDGFEQRIPQEGLLDSDDPGSRRLARDGRRQMSADQKCRNFHALIAQRGNQFQAIHSGHILIDNETLAVAKTTRSQQLLATRIGADGESLDFE
jgi:hypothetical protein